MSAHFKVEAFRGTDLRKTHFFPTRGAAEAALAQPCTHPWNEVHFSGGVEEVNCLPGHLPIEELEPGHFVVDWQEADQDATELQYCEAAAEKLRESSKDGETVSVEYSNGVYRIIFRDGKAVCEVVPAGWYGENDPTSDQYFVLSYTSDEVHRRAKERARLAAVRMAELHPQWSGVATVFFTTEGDWVEEGIDPSWPKKGEKYVRAEFDYSSGKVESFELTR